LGAATDQRNTMRSADVNKMSDNKAPVKMPNKHNKKTTQKRQIKQTKKPNPRKRNKNQPTQTQYSINENTATAQLQINQKQSIKYLFV